MGVAAAAALASLSGAASLWALPVYGGLLVAIPLTVLTSSPALGARMAARRWLAIPEDLDPPRELLALKLPALQGQSRVVDAGGSAPSTIPAIEPVPSHTDAPAPGQIKTETA
jgi:membrane glycosyltransferase